MARKAEIVITFKKGRHKTQPWTFIIDRPGKNPMVTARERYVTYTTARRGALRMVGVYDGFTTNEWWGRGIINGRSYRVRLVKP